MKAFDDRFMKGLTETDQSQAKKSAVVELRVKRPTFDVFQSNRRGLQIRDEETMLDFSKSKSCQSLPTS